MSAAAPAPPRLARHLVRAAIRDERWREVTLGDLAEEFTAIASARSATAAGFWYWRQAIALLSQHVVHGAVAFFRPTGDRLARTIVKEARFAVRSLASRPMTSAVILLTLALGLGANAATFGMRDALVGRPFALTNVDRLVLPSEDTQDSLYSRETVSPANFAEWRNESDLFTRLTAIAWWDVNVAGGNEPERLQGHRVTADFFPMLGVTPAMGRTLVRADEVWGQHRQVVIGDGLWRRRFNADPAIVGRTITLDGEPYDIVGVAPRGFDFPYGTEIWAPLAMKPEDAQNRAAHYVTAIAELQPGKTIEDAQARMRVIYGHQRDEFPDANRGRDLVVHTFTAGMTDPGLPRILALWQVASIIVLLIGCTNIAGLLLARAADRQRELAVRIAIGASRAQIVRQLLVESLVLSLVSIPAALATGWALARLIRSTLPASLLHLVPGWDRIGLDGSAVAITTVMAIAAALVFGLAPAFQSSRLAPGSTLKTGGRSMTGSRSQSRLRRGLVIAEIALALPLLIAAGLTAIAGARFASGKQGYNPDGLVQLRTALSGPAYATNAAKRQFTERLLDQARRLPGVARVATSSVLPATSTSDQRELTIDGVPTDPNSPRTVNYRAASPAFLETMQIPITRGRGLSDADRDGGQRVAVVSESLARAFFGTESPIGRRIRLGKDDQNWITVVGVSGDTIDDWLLSREQPTVFVAFAQFPTDAVNLVARVAGDPASYADGLRRALAAVDPAEPAFGVMTVQQAIHERTSGLRVIAQFMAGFGLITLALAAFGIYSVMANFVADRRHDIGVRMALGATTADVFGLTIGQGAKLTLAGLAIGFVAAVLLARVMERALFGIVSIEPILLVSMTAALALVALVATLVPAHRATRTDPMAALRAD